MKKLSERTGIAERTLEEEAKRAEEKFLRAVLRKKGEEMPVRPILRAERLYGELLGIALARNDFSLLDDCALFLDPAQKEILRVLASGARRSEDPAVDAAMELIVLREPPREISDEEVAKLKTSLAGEYYKGRRQIVAQAIKNAEARHDEKELRAALEELKDLPSGE